MAAELDDAATLAAERGASAVAAELAEQALRLTPPESGDRHRRALATARAHHAAGEWTRARTIATALLAEAEVGSVRADALVLLAELESVGRAVPLLEEALGEAVSRPALQAEIHCRLAWATRFSKGYVSALEHARAALELAEGLDDDVLRARARIVQAILGCIVGDADAPARAAGAGRRLRERLRRRATRAGGDVGRRENLRAILAEGARHAPGSSASTATRSSATSLGAPARSGACRGSSSGPDAGRSRPSTPPARSISRSSTGSRCRRTTFRSRSSPFIAASSTWRGAIRNAPSRWPRISSVLRPPQHLAILGLVALGSGDASGAAAWFDEADRQAAALGWGEPSIRWWAADQVELLLELGRIDDAVPVLDLWEADAARLGREWVLAQVTRCRGLVAAAGGDLEHALAGLERAVTEHEAVGDPFGRARALLALGVVRRRGHQKRLARETLEAAAGAFETIGAAGWAHKARAELARIGGRRPGGVELTPTERRLADARGPGPLEQGDRSRTLRDPEDGRYGVVAPVREARRPLAHRADSLPCRAAREQSVGILRLSAGAAGS